MDTEGTRNLYYALTGHVPLANINNVGADAMIWAFIVGAIIAAVVVVVGVAVWIVRAFWGIGSGG